MYAVCFSVTNCFVILDEQDEFVRQLNELKDKTAVKDSELCQLRNELTEMRKIAQVASVNKSQFGCLYYISNAMYYRVMLGSFGQIVTCTFKITATDSTSQSHSVQLNKLYHDVISQQDFGDR